MRSFSINVKTADIVGALRVGASVGLPLWALYASDHLHFAVYAAFGALTSLYGHSENIQRRVETQLVVGAALVLTLAAAVAYSAAQGPAWLLAVMLPLVVIGAGTLGAIMGWVPRGEIFFILVLLVIADIPLAPDDVLPALAAGVGGAGFSILLTLMERSGEVDPRSIALRVRARTARGTAALDPTQHAIVIIAAAFGVTCAWLLALAIHIGHPFWSPVAVAALMPALTSTDATRRTIQLMAGTLGGVGLGALLFLGEPGPLFLIALIAICQAIAELFVARNYAVALLFLTPLAIGMSNLGRNLPWSPLLIDRAVEAGLGATVALAMIVVGRGILARAVPQLGSSAER